MGNRKLFGRPGLLGRFLVVIVLAQMGMSRIQAGNNLNLESSTWHAPENTCPDPRATSRPPIFETPAVNPIVYDATRNRIYVADIPNGQIALIDPVVGSVIRNIPVGLGPSSLALAPIPNDPTRTRLYVANNLSDSVSVIDLDLRLSDGTRGTVVETITGSDGQGVSLLESPVGLVVTRDGRTGYVTLSRFNQVAVLDLTSLSINPTRFDVKTFDPRALALSADEQTLYVAGFTPGNRTQVHLKGMWNGQPFDEATLTWYDRIDILSLDRMTLQPDESYIEIDSLAPDPDLIALDLATGTAQSIGDVGSILYDLDVQGTTLHVAGMEALNYHDGFPDELAGRPYRNLVVTLPCTGLTCSPSVQHDIDLRAGTPDRSTSAAIPSAVVVAPDGSRLVTAQGSDVLLRVGSDGVVLGRYPVGSMPMGVAYNPSSNWAYVLNRGHNTVSLVNLQTQAVSTVPLQPDPLPDTLADGRRVFHNALHARNGSFACASCHPNGNTDNLVWNLGEGFRTTQTMHHIGGTAPYHWFGTLPDAITLVTNNFNGDNFQYRQPGEEKIGVPDDCQLAHVAEYSESIDLMPGPTRPITDKMSALARDGLAVVRRGQIILDNDLATVDPDPALASRLDRWWGSWVDVPDGIEPGQFNLYGDCARCHKGGLETAPPANPNEPNAPAMFSIYEETAQAHDARVTITRHREALNTFVDTINAEIDRRNLSRPPETQIPRLDDQHKILTDWTSAETALRAWSMVNHRPNLLGFNAKKWAFEADEATLLNPFVLIDRYLASFKEKSSGFSATLGQQVTANTTWNHEVDGWRLQQLLLSAQIDKISLRADGVLSNGQGGWTALQATYRPDLSRFVNQSGRAWSANQLIRAGRQGLGFVTFTGHPAGNLDLTAGIPVLDHVVRADDPARNGVRPMASLNALDGEVELLIRGFGFATGDRILNDGQLLGSMGEVATLESGQLEGHFVLTVDPAKADDYYVLSIHRSASAGGLISNEFAIPVTP